MSKKALGISLVAIGVLWWAATTYYMLVLGIGIGVKQVGGPAFTHIIAELLLLLIVGGWLMPLALGAWLLWKNK